MFEITALFYCILSVIGYLSANSIVLLTKKNLEAGQKNIPDKKCQEYLEFLIMYF